MSPRDRILEAAMTVFRRHGFRRSSIEETAEAAGLTRQALYHHFKSKEALFRAVIERVHDGALADGASAAERAEAAGDRSHRLRRGQLAEPCRRRRQRRSERPSRGSARFRRGGGL